MLRWDEGGCRPHAKPDGAILALLLAIQLSVFSQDEMNFSPRRSCKTCDCRDASQGYPDDRQVLPCLVAQELGRLLPGKKEGSHFSPEVPAGRIGKGRKKLESIRLPTDACPEAAPHSLKGPRYSVAAWYLAWIVESRRTHRAAGDPSSCRMPFFAMIGGDVGGCWPC